MQPQVYQSPVNRKKPPTMTMTSIAKRHSKNNKDLPDWVTSSIEWQSMCKNGLPKNVFSP